MPHKSQHQKDATEEFWSRLDDRLVSRKLRTPTKERRRKLEKEIAQAHRKHRENLNKAAFPSAWMEAHVTFIEGGLEDYYRVVCEVWQKQGNPLNPQFLRAVFTKHIEPTIEGLVEHYWGEFRRLFGTVPNRPDSDPILRSGRWRLDNAKRDLRDDWYSKVEVEATELEYAIVQRERTAMGSHEHKIAPEAAVPQGDKQSSRSSFSGVRAKSNKTGPRQRDPNVARRRALIGNILAKNARPGKKRTSNRVIGEMLDRERVPYPGSVYTTWKAALANAPDQVNKLIDADIRRTK